VGEHQRVVSSIVGTMPDVADVADVVRALTDAAVGQMSVIAPLASGGAMVLIATVVSCVAWLCVAEFRSRRTHRVVIRRSARHR
jgi:hypothetical protein